MRHRLHRLFTYARATEKPPLENFTTEALASAIEVDPLPLLRALPKQVLPGSASVDEARVRRIATQVRVTGGTVDLVAELLLDGQPFSLWVEVKAHSGMSGDQLRVYLEAIDRLPISSRPVLIMLCKRPITTLVPTLQWNTLRSQIDATRHEYWTDLRTFLEDHLMADEFDSPVTSDQFSVATDARALLRKAARLAHEFSRRDDLPPDWQKAEFPDSEAKSINAVARQFVRHGRLVVDSARYPWICFGFDFSGGSPAMTLWIEFQRNDQEAIDAVFKVASGLPSHWTCTRDDDTPWLGTSQSIAGDLAQDTALAWFYQRVQELEKAQVLAELPKWRRKHRLAAEVDPDQGTVDT